MGYCMLLLSAALIAGGSIVVMDLPSLAVAWLVLWPLYTGMLYLCMGGVYVMCFEWWMKDIFPSMKIKADDKAQERQRDE